MEEHTDYKEFERPDGKMVRVVFELYRYEILFYYFEFKHDANSNWQSLSNKDDNGFFSYKVIDRHGNEKVERVLFPTNEELSEALEEINKRYNIISM